uniref:Glycine cleavage system H protein n=1 Tax=Arcella intermedia TaxID=1963864 RepID=A0A6B2LMR3_9EUKA
MDEETRFSNSHEWVKEYQQGKGVIGITAHATEALGDIVFVELPTVGEKFKKGEAFATVESVKAASDVYMPVDGVIEEVNTELEESPGILNESPYVNGWMVKVSLDHPYQMYETDLVNEEDYLELLKSDK